MRKFTSVDYPLAKKYWNKTLYHYCSNNPIVRIDPDGKQDGYYQGMERDFMGNNPTHTIFSTVGQSMEQYAAIPNAFSVSFSWLISPFFAGIGGEITVVAFTKGGPKEGTLALYLSKKQQRGIPTITDNRSIEMIHFRGDERRLDEKALEGKSQEYSASLGGYLVNIGVSKSGSTTKDGDRVEGRGLSIGVGKGPVPISVSKEMKTSYHIGSIQLFSNDNENYNDNESTKDYYIRTKSGMESIYPTYNIFYKRSK